MSAPKHLKELIQAPAKRRFDADLQARVEVFLSNLRHVRSRDVRG
ncbi:hypothetical protein [Gemmata palustris]|nr:hypothetical protein [Gemmata palustris]